MSDSIRVLHDSDGTGSIPAGQRITVIFRHPQTGADLPVLVEAFQTEGLVRDDGEYRTDRFGVGVYMLADDGKPLHGTVTAWDRWSVTPGIEPRVIEWELPHCDDDECGKPCGHESPA